MPSGALGHVVDTRDLKFDDHFVTGSLVQKVIPDMRLWGYVPNQGRYERCVGYMLNRMLQVVIYQVMKEDGSSNPYVHHSENFIWGLGREMAGWPKENRGMYIRDAFKILFRIGTVPIGYFPKNRSPMKIPGEDLKAIADNYKRLLVKKKFKYYLLNKQRIKEIVSKGIIVGVGMMINKQFFSNKKYIDDSSSGNYAHAMTVEGIKEKDGIVYYKMGNWYGRGYVYVPEHLAQKWIYEAWVLEKK